MTRRSQAKKTTATSAQQLLRHNESLDDVSTVAGQDQLPDVQTVTTEIVAWMDDRNQKTWPADWRFTTEDARIKLKRLYPKLTN